MKKIVLVFMCFYLMFISFSAFPEGPVVDPTVTPTMTLICNYPIEREDGTKLAINEIATVNFFVSPSITTPDWQPADSDPGQACKQVYDMTAIADGQYYYTATVVDTDSRSLFMRPTLFRLSTGP